MNGWLEKKSEWRKVWNVRYFQLSGVTLKYSEQEGSSFKAQRVIKNPPTKINEMELSFVLSNDEGGSDSPSSDKEDVWQLRAGNKTDFDEWVQKLTKAAAAVAVPDSQQTGAVAPGAAVTAAGDQSVLRNRAQSVAVASFPGAGAAPAVDASAPAFHVAEKRSQHLKQWRCRVFTVGEGAGVVFYSAIDSLQPSVEEVRSAMRQPQRLQVVSVDIISPPSLLFDDGASRECRVLVSDGKSAAAASATSEEFPLRFRDRAAMVAFVAAVWHSLAKGNGGLLNVAQQLPTKCIAPSSSSGSVSSSSSSSLILNSHNNNSVLLSQPPCPAVVMFGGVSSSLTTRGGGAGSVGDSSAAAAAAAAPPEQLLRDAFKRPHDAIAFSPMDKFLRITLSGEHPHEVVAAASSSCSSSSVVGNSSFASAPTTTTSAATAAAGNPFPCVREGAAVSLLNATSGMLMLHGGTDDSGRVMADVWLAASVGSTSGISWREVSQQVVGLPALVGHTMVAHPAAPAGSCAVAILGGLDPHSRLQSAAYVVEMNTACSKFTCRRAGARLYRGRARHATCVLRGWGGGSDGWIVVAGGIAGSSLDSLRRESQAVEICSAKNLFGTGRKDDYGVEDRKKQQGVDEDDDDEENGRFVSMPMPLPVVISNPAMCPSPTKPSSEFFLLGDGGILLRGIINASGSGGGGGGESTTVPSLVFVQIQLGGQIPRAPVSAFGVEFVGRSFVYVMDAAAGSGSTAVTRILVE